MSCILFVSGGPLGHVTRLLSVASELKKVETAEIIFSAPAEFRYDDLVSSAGYKLHLIPTDMQLRNGVRMDLDTFPMGVERLIEHLNPKAIVIDCEQFRHFATMRWPRVPRILVTNVFLTQASDYETVQNRSFSLAKDLINTRRKSLRLDPMQSETELYEADLVCLADPQELVEQFNDLPRNFKPCGATFWENNELPTDDLPEIESTVLFSMGSTGGAKIESDLVEHLKNVTGAKSAIYAGLHAADFAGSQFMDYAATLMPLQHYFPKTKLVITQGGAGSTYQALSYGLPVAILPSHRNQEILGEALQKLGLAFCISSPESRQAFQPDIYRNLAEHCQLYGQKAAKTKNGPEEIARQIGDFLRKNPTGGETKVKTAKQKKAVRAARKFRYANSSTGALANNPQHNFALRQTMMIFESNACCTWIPKNGCSTVRFSIAKANGCVNDLADINWIHSNNQTFTASTESAFRASYAFAILRCPYSRLYSAFMDKIVNFDIQAWKFHAACGRTTHPHDMTFKKFVFELKEMNPSSFDIHWRRQVDFLLFKNYDDIFSFDAFSDFSDTVKRKIGLEIVDTRTAVGHETSGQAIDSTMPEPYNLSALDLLNLAKQGHRPDPEMMFNPEITSAVQAIYKRDLFLYKKNFGNSDLMERFG